MRKILFIAMFIAVGLTALIPVIANPRVAPRDIVLVMRDMTFYLEGSDVPNPTLAVKRGEDIRLIVRNQDPGITHAFSLPALARTIDRIEPRATTTVSCRAPAATGRHDYLCPPHAQMMRGVLAATESP